MKTMEEIDRIIPTLSSKKKDLRPQRKCRKCGCTDERACIGGCYWVEQDLCSNCALDIKLRQEWNDAIDYLDFYSSKCFESNPKQIEAVNKLKYAITEAKLIPEDVIRLLIILLGQDGSNSKKIARNILSDLLEG